MQRYPAIIHFIILGTSLGLGGCDPISATDTAAAATFNDTAARTNITREIFSKRTADCADYADYYSAQVKDIQRTLNFKGHVDLEVQDDYCRLISDNIPNHDFNDASAYFRTPVAKKTRTFQIKRAPQVAAQTTPIQAQVWDAVMLNGVVVDVQSGGCYKPSAANADNDGNTEAGCGPSDGWRLIPLNYSTKFGADSHNAHVQPDGTYHYHGSPNAMFDENPTGDGSPVIGFAADGFPIYGSYIMDSDTGNYRKVTSGYTLKSGSRGTQSSTNPGGTYTGLYEADWEWTDAGDLDACNGMTYQGQYGYYVTDAYPFIINCFKGQPDASFNK